ncbi:hypothetical protein PISL3812_08128 [Talaromyces islandicus]|uniref:DUF7770 domain-containing protein n=1 Tax=Talaromyces islandicus TaxID=28573 RepID=A0A0U1M7Y7_TALIS|nr:hypothetical protein PISL3812_08128 [Talaromyces islandicus]
MENYDTDRFNTAHFQSSVVNIHLCGYRNEKNEGDEDGNPPTNHWAAFLQYPSGGSARLDMAPGYGSDGLRGKIDLASKPYMLTNNAIKSLSFSPKTPITVQSIVNTINSKGRDRYRFTAEWEGCRYWMYTFILDLESAGILASGSGQATWQAVSYYWRNPSGFEPREVKRGRFY